MSDQPIDITSLEARVEAMRRLGVTEWGDIKLGPDPAHSTALDHDEPQRLSAAELEHKSRVERRRIASASSGGPLKRVESR